MRRRLLIWWLSSACLWAGDAAVVVKRAQYYGLSDASAAVAVSTNLFLVADDEVNTLCLYSTEAADLPLATFDLSSFLEVEGKFPEADLEGAARIGDRAFWIGSHGANRSGKERLSRCRLFAVDIGLKGSQVTVTPVGRPYAHLLEQLESDPRFQRFHFQRAARRPPKEPGGLAIEGLAATPEGGLLIGFRNPLFHGRALIIPLLNPNEVIAGRRPRFGSEMQVDLGGLGVRDLAFWKGQYVILAGPTGLGSPFRLYEWQGARSPAKPFASIDWGDLSPEAIIIYPDRGLQELQILSDDGQRLIGGVPMKKVENRQEKSFRSIWVRP
jgi:hypothetical protein